MRIKKKHVLLESLLIDVTNEFTPIEKKIFKILNKHYGDPMREEEGKKSFNQWDSAAWLIETLNIPYEEAYELTKTYFWNYKKLFKEISKLRKRVPMPYLFFEHHRKLLDMLMNKYEDSIYTNISVNIDRDSGFEDNRTVRLWGAFKGFSLYIPMDIGYVGDKYVTTTEARERMIMVKTTFFPINKEGIKVDGYISDEQWENEIDQNNFMVQVNTEFGPEETKVVEELMVFEVPYPKPLTPENFEKTILTMVDDIIEKLTKTTFKLPNTVGSINVNNQPD